MNATQNVRSFSKAVDLLMIEDNRDDADLLMESFRMAEVRFNVSVVKDGEEALAYLRKEGKYAQANSPELILLDLNLPGKNGYEVLAEMNATESLKRIPVIILTSSRSDQAILKSYEKQAGCYITKPLTMEQFVNVARSIESWFKSVRQSHSR